MGVDDGADFGLQRIADGIEEFREGRVTAGLGDTDAGDEMQLVEVIGDGVGHADVSLKFQVQSLKLEDCEAKMDG